MIIHRDNSPERISDQDRLQLKLQKESVQSKVYFAVSALYGEWGYTWSAEAQDHAASRVTGAGNVIDHAFQRADIEAQASELAADRAVEEARLRIEEIHDYELPA